MLPRIPPPPAAARGTAGDGGLALAERAIDVLAPAVVGGYDPLAATLLAMAAASAVLGVYVGYQAYRGFRRNDSVPMKFLSLGLLLLTGVGYGLSFGGSLAFQYGLAPEVLRPAWQLAVRGAQLAGLACIVYSLYRKP